MQQPPSVRQYVISAIFLMIVGWGGLALILYVFQLPPLVWARWAFFVLWFAALTGTALPAAYFLNLRFPSKPSAEPHTVVRQAMWIGVYGCLAAWLQLGRVMAFWIWIGLAGGFVAVEYVLRLRERARWKPPTSSGSARQAMPDTEAESPEPSMEGNGFA